MHDINMMESSRTVEVISFPQIWNRYLNLEFV